MTSRLAQPAPGFSETREAFGATVIHFRIPIKFELVTMAFFFGAPAIFFAYSGVRLVVALCVVAYALTIFGVLAQRSSSVTSVRLDPVKRTLHLTNSKGRRALAMDGILRAELVGKWGGSLEGGGRAETYRVDLVLQSKERVPVVVKFYSFHADDFRGMVDSINSALHSSSSTTLRG